MLIATIIFLFLPILLVLLPWLCFGKQTRRMTRFYLRMTASCNCRRLYLLVIMLALLAFHFCYLCVNGRDAVLNLAPSTLLTFSLFLPRFAERLMRFLQDKTTLFFCFMVALVCTFGAHTFTTAVTLAAIIDAAVFYPSQRVVEMISIPHDRKLLLDNPRNIVNFYYRWDD